MQRLSVFERLGKQRLQEIVDHSTSLREVIQNCGLSTKGSGFYVYLHRAVRSFNIDLSRMQPKIWSSGTAKPMSELLVLDPSTVPRRNLKKRLLKEKILENKCTNCQLGPEWHGKPISLQLDHINGNTHDNRIENLRILCPNCHSQTETFGTKRFKVQTKENHCVTCSAKITPKSIRCRKCAGIANQRVQRPPKEQLQELIRTKSYTDIAKLYGVSDNCIRKWEKIYNQP